MRPNRHKPNRVRRLRKNGEAHALIDRWRETKAQSEQLFKEFRELKRKLEPVFEETRKVRAAVLATNNKQRTPPAY